MPERFIIVCPLFRRELDVLRAEGRLGGAQLETLQRSCDPGVSARVKLGATIEHRAASRPCTLCLGGECLRGVTVSPLVAERVRIFAPPTCFELLAPSELVDRLIAQGSYLVTPGWLGQWRSFLAEWGLDRETARLLFRESARRVVLLDTGVRADVVDLLAEFADYIGLPCEVVPVGLEHLAQTLAGLAPQGEGSSF